MRDKIRMVSSAGTGHFYTTDKNKRNTPDKLEMKKFDRWSASVSSTRKPRSSDRDAAALMRGILPSAPFATACRVVRWLPSAGS